MNRLSLSARHSEKVTRKLIDCYARLDTLERTRRVTGLSVNRISQINDDVRKKMHPHFERLSRAYQNSGEYKKSLHNHFNSTLAKVVMLRAGGLDVSRDQRTFSFAKKLDPNVMEKIKAEVDADREQVIKQVHNATEVAVDHLRNEYISYHRRRRRGNKGINNTEFQAEYSFRFIVMEHVRAGAPINFGLLERYFSHPRFQVIRSISIQVGMRRLWFEPNQKQSTLISSEIISVLENDPLR